eukprot:scaffold170259_cov22-Prasinocladus_malaysianus.AAC.2
MVQWQQSRLLGLNFSSKAPLPYISGILIDQRHILIWWCWIYHRPPPSSICGLMYVVRHISTACCSCRRYTPSLNNVLNCNGDDDAAARSPEKLRSPPDHFLLWLTMGQRCAQ